MSQSKIDNRGPRRGKPNYHVKLTCGCSFPLVMKPSSGRATFMCVNGMGHGYSLRWVESLDLKSGRVFVNAKMAG